MFCLHVNLEQIERSAAHAFNLLAFQTFVQNGDLDETHSWGDKCGGGGRTRGETDREILRTPTPRVFLSRAVKKGLPE